VHARAGRRRVNRAQNHIDRTWDFWGGNALAWIVMTVYVAGMLYTLVSRFIG